MICVFGSINLDLIFALDRLPLAGETVLGPGTQIEPGGKGANQAVAAALDGAAVVMVGAVGRDALAEGALAGLRGAGVDIGRVAAVEAATGCASICTDVAGRNLIAVGSGANRLASADQVEDTLLGPGCTLVLQMEVPAAETAALIGRARARGARTVLNLAPALPIEPAALREVDVLVVNEHEAAWLAAQLGTGAAAAALHRALGPTVVRTLGAAGSEFAGTAGAGVVAAYPVDVVDTTAAGDCLTGVLAAGLDRGMGLAAALRRASVAAGLCCAARGSQGSLPRRQRTDLALRANLR
ncbi:MAG: ribokinase [Acetobacteraceae bacterium]